MLKGSSSFPRLVWKSGGNCWRLHHTVIFAWPTFISIYPYSWVSSLSHGCSEAKIGTKYAKKYCPGFSDEIWNFREGGGRLAMTRKGEGGGGVHGFQHWSNLIIFNTDLILISNSSMLLSTLLYNFWKLAIWIRFLSTIFVSDQLSAIFTKQLHRSTKWSNTHYTLVGKITWSL